jgi:hypothetical protein
VANYPSNVGSYTIEGLIPDTTYNLEIGIIGEDDQYGFVAIPQFTTASAYVPGSINSFQAIDITSNEITLT